MFRALSSTHDKSTFCSSDGNGLIQEKCHEIGVIWNQNDISFVPQCQWHDSTTIPGRLKLDFNIKVLRCYRWTCVLNICFMSPFITWKKYAQDKTYIVSDMHDLYDACTDLYVCISIYLHISGKLYMAIFETEYIYRYAETSLKFKYILNTTDRNHMICFIRVYTTAFDFWIYAKYKTDDIFDIHILKMI